MASAEYDRHITEHAAIGAGYTVCGWVADELMVKDNRVIAPHNDPFRWNPLKNRTQAFVLSAEIGMTINCENLSARKGQYFSVQDPSTGEDPVDLLCLAIVRVAAAIGVAKKIAEHL